MVCRSLRPVADREQQHRLPITAGTPTDLRAVRDPASDTGWTIELGAFAGWAAVPSW